MRKIHGKNPEGLLCGLRKTALRETSHNKSDITCQACRATFEVGPIFITADQLALKIYGNNKSTFDWLMKCKVQSGGVVRDAKVFFNLKSRNHKHVILVNDSDSWRRKYEHEVPLEEGSVLNEKYKKQS